MMKYYIASLLLLSAFFSFAEQSISGSKSSYHYSTIPTLTAAPPGYQPFYINHIGRHGARYISKSKYETIIQQILQLAEQQQLTILGRDLLTQLNKIIALNHNQYGKLTELGKDDLKQIASRMLHHYPTIFHGNHIATMSTTSQRTIDSARAFLSPFEALYANLEIQQQPEHNQTLLRFFDYSPAYTKYKNSHQLKQQIHTLEQRDLTKFFSQHIIHRIFTPSFISKLNNGIKMTDETIITSTDFVIALFNIFQETFSFTPEILHSNQINFDNYFTPLEKEWFTTVVTAKNYLQIGPAFDNNGIQIKIAAPLLLEIIRSSDHAIHSNDTDANFRFAHAETLSPLATLMELEGTFQITDTIENYPHFWHAEQIIPMGANIQLIFYRSTDITQPLLVKVLLNEREIHLPVETTRYPYYQWTDVKQFYINKLNHLGLTEEEDIKHWLLNLN